MFIARAGFSTWLLDDASGLEIFHVLFTRASGKECGIVPVHVLLSLQPNSRTERLLLNLWPHPKQN